MGIADPCKVIHSLRHRAQDRLRAAVAPKIFDGRFWGMRKRPSPRVMAKVSGPGAQMDRQNWVLAESVKGFQLRRLRSQIQYSG